MKRLIKTGWIVIVTGAILAFATTAMAQTSGKTPDFTAHPELAEIADEMEALWLEEPELFEKLKESRDAVVELDGQTGPRPVPVARILQGAGQNALMPMLWHLVSEDPMELGMGLRTWRSWRVGLVEAVGRLRDERSIPVLHSIVIDDNPHEQLRTAAAAAIGRSGDLDAIDDVIDVARSSSDKRGAIIAGLGKARRTNAAEYLLEVAQSSEEGEHHVAAVRALGDWANQWAWDTPEFEAHRAERDKAVRAIIELLVAAYPQADGRLATEIEKSLQLAGAQATKERALTRAEDADGEREDSLKELAEVMANSPLD